nr:EOG090X0J7Y [Eulimnadia texana]
MGFAASANDDSDYSFSSRRKIARDPMSHRIIEKRRRDRMNNCLADLSRLLPASFLKKGRGRIEKTEIIEMAIKHLKYLQAHACAQTENNENGSSLEGRPPPIPEQYRLGYHDCISEVLHFLVEVEGFFAEDAFCVRLVGHLQQHFEFLSSGEIYNPSEAPSSSMSSGSCRDMEIKVTGSSISSSEEVQGINSGSSSATNSVYSSEKCEEKQNGSLNHTKADHSRVNSKGSVRSTEGSSSSLSPECDTLASLKNSSSPENNLSSNDHDNSCGSQLREMLLSSNPDNCRKKLSSHSDDASGMYKFKTNIHQRFAAEHVYPSPSKNAQEQAFIHLSANDCSQDSFEEPKRRRVNQDVPSPSPCRKEDVNSSFQICREESPELSPAPQYTILRNAASASKNGRFSRNATNLDCVATNQETLPLAEQLPNPRTSRATEAGASGTATAGVVPIFALHPQGSYYVPLSLETSLVLPLLENIPEGSAMPILHPISISVNFCHPARTITIKQQLFQSSSPVIPAANNRQFTPAEHPRGKKSAPQTNDSTKLAAPRQTNSSTK